MPTFDKGELTLCSPKPLPTGQRYQTNTVQFRVMHYLSRLVIETSIKWFREMKIKRQEC